MKKALIVVCIIGLLIVTGFVLKPKNSEAPPTNESVSQTTSTSTSQLNVNNINQPNRGTAAATTLTIRVKVR